MFGSCGQLILDNVKTVVYEIITNFGYDDKSMGTFNKYIFTFAKIIHFTFIIKFVVYIDRDMRQVL